MPIWTPRIRFFLLLDGAILFGLIVLYSVCNHPSIQTRSTLSERIFITPEAGETTPGTQPERETLQPPPAAMQTGSPGAIQLNRLRSSSVTVLVHNVELKENYWSIASDNDIDIYTLIGANPDLPFRAALGHPVNILSRRGVLHNVEKDETLKTICALYKCDEKLLASENHLTWWHGLRIGDVLFVPNVKPLRMTEDWRNYFSKRGIFGIPFASWGKGWTSGFGWRKDPITGERKIHKGVDFKAHYGEAVYAAGTGTVIFAGVSGGYGNLIQIKHPNGYITMYGHLSKIYVKGGHHVRRGEIIGRVGATGRVTGPHLHFEIRKNGKAIDPLQMI